MFLFTHAGLMIYMKSIRNLHTFAVMHKKQWFETWFDTEYYHILYKHRDENEADLFIDKLVRFLNIPVQSKVLDLACGKGRHATVLHRYNLEVLGVDLSKNSIKEANEANNGAKPGLTFSVHDMRHTIPNRKFDVVFNLFTSFGYFDTIHDNQQVINAIWSMLNPNGLLIIDFMNANKVINHLVSKEHKRIDGIDFHIERIFDDMHIRKKIEVLDGKKNLSFEEKVQALRYKDFLELMGNKFRILHCFGNYNLEDFNENNSERLILIANKI